MNDLSHYFHAQACNNAWSNLRLLRACAALDDAEFAAPRTGFFPSLKDTLNSPKRRRCGPRSFSRSACGRPTSGPAR